MLEILSFTPEMIELIKCIVVGIVLAEIVTLILSVVLIVVGSLGYIALMIIFDR